MNLLMVDDEVTMIQILVKALPWEEIGFQNVFTAYNAEVAREIMLTSHIDIMICDIEMPQESAARESAAAGSEEAEPEKTSADAVLKDGEITELLMIWPAANASPADMQAVEDAINAVVAEHVDAKVKLQIIEWGSYSDQINLMLSSGEKLDIFFTASGINEMAGRGQLYPIKDLVGVYAPDAAEAMSRYIDACYFDGELYGLPSYRDCANQGGFVCRKDVLEETGYMEDDIKTWDDVEELLKKVQEIHPDMYPMIPANTQNGPFNTYLAGVFDIITSGVGCYIDDTDGHVDIINTYATEEYLEMAKKAQDWNEKGYFMPDSTTSSAIRSDLIKAGNSFGYYGNVHPGTVTQETMNSGRDMVAIPMSTRILTTTLVNFCQWLIPAQCENPAKALAVLNLLYSDSEVQNLFRYGIEGLDYEVKDEGKGIVGYPEGVTSDSVGWGNEMWLTGNASVGYAWETDPENVFDKYSEYNDTAVLSPLYGFLYDSSNVKNEISAISNVTDKYKSIIEAGLADPETTVAKFNEELESAGISRVIEDMQQQVDDWMNN